MFITVNAQIHIPPYSMKTCWTYEIEAYELLRGSIWFKTESVNGYGKLTHTWHHEPGREYLVQDYDGNILLDLKVH